MSKLLAITEENYRASQALSRSDLLILEKSPRLFAAYRAGELERGDSEARRIGRLIDCQVLTPHLFRERYVKRPSNVIDPNSSNKKMFCEEVIKGTDPVLAYTQCYSVKGKKDSEIEVAAERLHEEMLPYIEFSASLEGQEVFSEDDEAKMLKMKNSILTHPLAARLLDENRDAGHYQFGLEYYSAKYDVRLRTLMDRVKVDHVLKVIWNIELKKTGFPLKVFPREYRKWDYGFQQAFYRASIGVWAKDQGIDYPIRTVCVVVEDHSSFDTRVFQPSDELLIREAHRIQRILSEYAEYKKRGRWDLTLHEQDGRGPFIIDVWKSD